MWSLHQIDTDSTVSFSEAVLFLNLVGECVDWPERPPIDKQLEHLFIFSEWQTSLLLVYVNLRKQLSALEAAAVVNNFYRVIDDGCSKIYDNKPCYSNVAPVLLAITNRRYVSVSGDNRTFDLFTGTRNAHIPDQPVTTGYTLAIHVLVVNLLNRWPHGSIQEYNG